MQLLNLCFAQYPLRYVKVSIFYQQRQEKRNKRYTVSEGEREREREGERERELIRNTG